MGSEDDNTEKTGGLRHNRARTEPDVLRGLYKWCNLHLLRYAYGELNRVQQRSRASFS